MAGIVGEGSDIRVEALTREIIADGYRPDIILAIARGGVCTAAALGYELGVKLLHDVNVDFYTGIDARLNRPVMLPPIPNLADLPGSRVLIADDVADPGATIKLTQEFVER